MGLLEIFWLNATVVSLLMAATWLISIRARNVSIVDIAWGSGFVVIAWASFLSCGSASSRELALVVCTTIWGIRLSSYLAWRNIGKPEDHRYHAMRARIGPRFPLVSLFTVFGLQGVVMWIVSLPLQTGQMMQEAHTVGFVALSGIAIWLIGIAFETIGDWQLARFKHKTENERRVMDRGLWRYTRHPNYFGDFLVWWGLYLIAWGDGRYWWSIVGPLLMSVCLLRVSGVTLLEKALVERREGYADYMLRTSSFFPLPPRRIADNIPTQK